LIGERGRHRAYPLDRDILVSFLQLLACLCSWPGGPIFDYRAQRRLSDIYWRKQRHIGIHNVVEGLCDKSNRAKRVPILNYRRQRIAARRNQIRYSVAPWHTYTSIFPHAHAHRNTTYCRYRYTQFTSCFYHRVSCANSRLRLANFLRHFLSPTRFWTQRFPRSMFHRPTWTLISRQW